jgi:hypothetical protein
MTVSKRFQAVANDIFRPRIINIPQRLEELNLVLECGEPSEISSNILCQYQEMRGLDWDNGLPQRLSDVYLVFKPEANPIDGSPINALSGKVFDSAHEQRVLVQAYMNNVGEENPTLKRLIYLSIFETFGQFTATLKLPWIPGQFFVPPRSVVCDKTVRLGRSWLENGESRIFWLDDAEHIGIRLRALQLDELEVDYTLDEDDNIWELNVEGMASLRLCFMCDRMLMFC